MDKKSLISGITVSLILISLVAAMQGVEVAEANFYMPPANTAWNIQSPLNSTYSTNNITLNFTVETNLGLLYFYSLDGQERKEINTTTISQVPLPEYPPFIDGSLWNRRTHQASTTLPYLSAGTHNLTIYQIYPLSKDNPQNGNVVSQALIIFNITSNLSAENPSSASPTQSPPPSPIELPYVVVTFIPTPNSTNIPLNTTIAVSFARPPSICNLSITPNVTITEKILSEKYGGYDTIYFLIDQLEPQTTYTVTVTYGQETAPEGYKPTTNRTWQFTTGTSINPPLSPSPIISPSPTQQPTLEPSSNPNVSQENLISVAVIVGAVIAVAAALGLLFYSVKRSGRKQRSSPRTMLFLEESY